MDEIWIAHLIDYWEVIELAAFSTKEKAEEWCENMNGQLDGHFLHPDKIFWAVKGAVPFDAKWEYMEDEYK